MEIVLSMCKHDARHPLEPDALDNHGCTALDYIEAHLRLDAGQLDTEIEALRACQQRLVTCGGYCHIPEGAQGAAAFGSKRGEGVAHVGISKKAKTPEELEALRHKHEAARQVLSDRLLVGRCVSCRVLSLRMCH